MRKNTRRTPYYLDVAEYILSGPFSPKVSPAFVPIDPDPPDVHNFQQAVSEDQKSSTRASLPFNLFSFQDLQNPTPLNLPLYIEFESGQPSPYLKELLSKVGTSQVEFWDFTLGGDSVILRSIQDGDEYLNGREQYQQQPNNQEMSIIEEESDEQMENVEYLKDHPYEYNPEDYVPNMHLLDIDPSMLSLDHFHQTLLNLQGKTLDQKREFVSVYLTDEDLQLYKDAELPELIEISVKNLSTLGLISRLERKAKVSRYLQKKKKRIWRKKINYDCRKKVADNRLRVKGKFVTREQACSMLGIQLCSQQELKELLRTRFSKMVF